MSKRKDQKIEPKSPEQIRLEGKYTFVPEDILFLNEETEKFESINEIIQKGE